MINKFMFRKIVLLFLLCYVGGISFSMADGETKWKCYICGMENSDSFSVCQSCFNSKGATKTSSGEISRTDQCVFEADVWSRTESGWVENLGLKIDKKELKNDEWMTPCLHMYNVGNEDVELEPSAVVDGKSIHFDNMIIKANDHKALFLYKNVAEKYFYENGEHNAEWYINGEKVGTTSWIVYEAEEASTADEDGIENSYIKGKISICIRTKSKIIKQLEDTVIINDGLNEGEWISPCFDIRNNGDKTVTVKAYAMVDGDRRPWDDITLESGKNVYLLILEDSVKPYMTPGSHSATLYINNQIESEYSWTVAGRATALKKANIRVFPDKKSAKLGNLNAGDKVYIIDDSQKYWKIQYGDIVGYVHEDYLKRD